MPHTVIVPIHNEAAVLRRSLGGMIEGLPDTIEILAVCNGCTDESADIARSFAPRVEVIELDEAPEALRALGIGRANFAHREGTETVYSKPGPDGVGTEDLPAAVNAQAALRGDDRQRLANATTFFGEAEKSR